MYGLVDETRGCEVTAQCQRRNIPATTLILKARKAGIFVVGNFKMNKAPLGATFSGN
jgi:hypothetical protein